MFAGIMMTAICGGMDGLFGLAGRKWVFIIDGLITLPIAVFGFLFFPDLQKRRKLHMHGRTCLGSQSTPFKTDKGHKVGWSLIKRTLLTRNFWFVVILWGFGGLLEATHHTLACFCG